MDALVHALTVVLTHAKKPVAIRVVGLVKVHAVAIAVTAAWEQLACFSNGGH